MNSFHDPELDDILQDDDLRHMAAMLASSRTHEPPLDEAFRTGLRRQLMKEAWAMSEGRESWWRRLFAPPGLAWAGAAAGLLLIASVAVWTATQPFVSSTIEIRGNVDGDSSVELHQPILVSFNQPMDHPSTEAAVQIAPATTVTFSWSANTLAVQPKSGNLAPNTQYKVTIGPGAKTASGKQLSAAQTITFVTQAPPTPAPQPSPRATPPNALGEKQLTPLGGTTALRGQWSADSKSLYFLDGAGALKVVPAGGGNPTVIAPDGVTSISLTPAGDRLAYIRAGKIEILTFASGLTAEIVPATAPTIVGWAKGSVLWATATAIYTVGGDGGAQQVAALPSSGTVSAISIAPDGGHAAYTKDGNLFVLDLSSSNSIQLGQGAATFAGWSPGGEGLLYAADNQVVVADTQGVTESTLPLGDASWSTQDAIALGSDTSLSQVRPDGSNLTRLGNGTYHSPLWAPNGTTFAFVRGASVWTATAPALPPIPSALDEATGSVDSFMKARLAGDSDLAGTLLDDNGTKAYASGGLNLVIGGDPRFSRYYILTSEITANAPDSALVVVRLVLSHDKVDVSSFEETLALVRDPNSKLFVIDGASASQRHDLGKGAQVVSVDVEPDTVKITFDSDLDPGTVTDGVSIVDSKGKQVDATVSYANRVVTLTGLGLKEGSQYTLVVQTGVRDVLGQNVSGEYHLNFLGPSGKKHTNHKDVVTPSPSPSPAAA